MAKTDRTENNRAAASNQQLAMLCCAKEY